MYGKCELTQSKKKKNSKQKSSWQSTILYFEIVSRFLAHFLFFSLSISILSLCSIYFVQVLYPELLKRLDDSNDDVRRTICATIAVYFHAPAPGAFSSTCYGYMIDTLLIHLDDPEEEMQKCVLGTLEAAIEIVPEIVAMKATKAVDSHRDGEMAEELAEKAKKKIAEK